VNPSILSLRVLDLWIHKWCEKDKTECIRRACHHKTHSIVTRLTCICRQYDGPHINEQTQVSVFGLQTAETITTVTQFRRYLRFLAVTPTSYAFLYVLYTYGTVQLNGPVNNKTGHVRINVKLRRVRATSVVVIIISVIYSKHVSVALCYPACYAHAPYSIVIYGLSAYAIFSHTMSQTARISGGGGSLKCVLNFSTTFVANISYSENNSTRYCHKCTQLFM
jgi:hypothetical protein